MTVMTWRNANGCEAYRSGAVAASTKIVVTAVCGGVAGGVAAANGGDCANY